MKKILLLNFFLRPKQKSYKERREVNVLTIFYSLEIKLPYNLSSLLNSGIEVLVSLLSRSMMGNHFITHWDQFETRGGFHFSV